MGDIPTLKVSLGSAGEVAGVLSGLSEGDSLRITCGSRQFAVSDAEGMISVESIASNEYGCQTVSYGEERTREEAVRLASSWVIDYPFARVSGRMLEAYQRGTTPSLADRVAAAEPKTLYQDGVADSGESAPLLPGGDQNQQTPAVAPPAPAAPPAPGAPPVDQPPIESATPDDEPAQQQPQTASRKFQWEEPPQNPREAMVMRVACANPQMTMKQVLAVVDEAMQKMESVSE